MKTREVAEIKSLIDKFAVAQFDLGAHSVNNAIQGVIDATDTRRRLENAIEAALKARDTRAHENVVAAFRAIKENYIPVNTALAIATAAILDEERE